MWGFAHLDRARDGRLLGFNQIVMPLPDSKDEDFEHLHF